MSDVKSNNGKQDELRINVNQEHEVKYWTEVLGINADNLRDAIAEVGPMVKDVRRQLGQSTDTTPKDEEKNAGSANFNQGSEQDPHYNEGVEISDEAKRDSRPRATDNG